MLLLLLLHLSLSTSFAQVVQLGHQMLRDQLDVRFFTARGAPVVPLPNELAVDASVTPTYLNASRSAGVASFEGAICPVTTVEVDDDAVEGV